MKGMRIALTRPVETSANWSGAIRKGGGYPLHFPLVEIRLLPVDRLVPDQAFLIIFTSVNAIRALMQDARMLNAIRHIPVVTVGSASCAAAKQAGFYTVHEAETKRAEGVFSWIEARFLHGRGGRIVYPRGNLADDELANRLTAAGYQVVAPIFYETRALSAEGLLTAARRGRIDVVTFASGSAVTAFAAGWHTERMRVWLDGRLQFLSIGPQTSNVMRACNLRVDEQARAPDSASVVAALQRLALNKKDEAYRRHEDD